MEMKSIGNDYRGVERPTVGPSKKVTSFSQLSEKDLDQMIEKAGEDKIVGRSEVRVEEKKAPYSFLAKDDGVQKTVSHNGVIFVCDDQNQSLNLGDVSNYENVIIIPLENGGCLKVNRDNLDQLAKAIDLFSPADVGRIMRAIATDTRIQQMKQEIEEQKNSVINMG